VGEFRFTQSVCFSGRNLMIGELARAPKCFRFINLNHALANHLALPLAPLGGGPAPLAERVGRLFGSFVIVLFLLL